ncbi:MAG: aminopeptidase [Methanocellales archaeon]
MNHMKIVGGITLRDINLTQLAKNALRALLVKPGDCLYIKSGTHTQAFVEEIAFQSALIGAYPIISTSSDRYFKRLLEEVPIDWFKNPPRHEVELVKAIDGYIIIEPYEDPSILLGHRVKLAAYREGRSPIREIIYSKPGKKWLYMGWPSRAMARKYHISYRELKRLILSSCLIDHDELRSNCEALKRILENARYIHIKDTKGTDLKLEVTGRRINLDDGIATEEKHKAGDLGGNLPAGEVFIAPVETYGEGKLYCPLTIDKLTEEIIKGATLVFRNGKLILEECSAEEGEEALKDTVKRMIELDLKRYNQASAISIGELGIGLNPVIDRAIGYILTDEKIGGSVHVAIGDNQGYGGMNKSNLHWDFVTEAKATIEVEYLNGEKRIIMENGKLALSS